VPRFVRAFVAMAIVLPRLHEKEVGIPENPPAFHRSQHCSGISSQIERNVSGSYERINSTFVLFQDFQ
jgi:hypothetical protein